MGIPKPITFTAAEDGYSGPAPEAFVVVGGIPGGGGEAATWATLAGKPAVIAAGVDAAAARAAIGAGTGSSSLAVATTAPAALAAAAAVGTGTTAARADHVHPFPTAANVGAPTTAQYTALEARVAALEAAGA